MEEDLEILSDSMFFHMIFLFGSLISYILTNWKRKQTLAAICGETIPDYPILKIKIGSSLVSFAALTYFLLLSLKIWREASTPEGCLSAKINYIASLLAIIAGVLRLFDLCVLGELPLSPLQNLEEAVLPGI